MKRINVNVPILNKQGREQENTNNDDKRNSVNNPIINRQHRESSDNRRINVNVPLFNRRNNVNVPLFNRRNNGITEHNTDLIVGVQRVQLEMMNVLQDLQEDIIKLRLEISEVSKKEHEILDYLKVSKCTVDDTSNESSKDTELITIDPSIESTIIDNHAASSSNSNDEKLRMTEKIKDNAFSYLTSSRSSSTSCYDDKVRSFDL